MAEFYYKTWPKSIAVRALRLNWTNGDVSNDNRFKIDKVLNAKPEAEGYFVTCIFGTDKERYLDPFISFVPKYKAFIPSWAVRVYLAPDVPQEWQDALLAADVEICLMQRPPQALDGAMWRFLELRNQKPAIIIDSDHYYIDRKFHEVPLWLKSGKQFYYTSPTMRMAWPMQAGCWGTSGAPVPQIEQLLHNFSQECNAYGCDELFLTQYIFPLMKSDNTYSVNYWHTHEVFIVLIFILLVVWLVAVLIVELGSKRWT